MQSSANKEVLHIMQIRTIKYECDDNEMKKTRYVW